MSFTRNCPKCHNVIEYKLEWACKKAEEKQKKCRKCASSMKNMKGPNNPFYGKKHSEDTKQRMRKNHADITGDKNPFKQSLKDPIKRQAHRERCKVYWNNRTHEQRREMCKYKRTGYEDISGNFWAQIKNSGRMRDLEFTITPEQIWNLFLQQNKRCALSGVELTMPNGHLDRTYTASLDRIDSEKGYVLDNVQWVHKQINIMKREFSDESFVNQCIKIAKYKRPELFKDLSNDSSQVPQSQENLST